MTSSKRFVCSAFPFSSFLTDPYVVLAIVGGLILLVNMGPGKLDSIIYYLHWLIGI